MKSYYSRINQIFYKEKSLLTFSRYPISFNDKKDPTIHTGRAEGLQLVLDAHTDQISSGSIADNFRGFHVVIDGKEKYPFTSRNGILIKTGQTNEVSITATRFEADPRIKSVPTDTRRCFFSDEYSLNLTQNYSQANCFFECKVEYIREKLFNKTGKYCIPWFYPRKNSTLYEICDPWVTWTFQEELKIVADNVTGCKECLRDCSSTKYKSSISSAPFRKCDQTNIGVSPLCDLSEEDSNLMMMNPPIWKHEVRGEYEKFNGGDIPDFFENQPGVLSNLRHFAPNQEVQNLVLRAHREKQLTYNAFERDITLVNFYFADSKVIQFKTDLRMTPIDFISSVSTNCCLVALNRLLIF